MSQRLAIFISVALTAFVLVIAGAVVGRVSLNAAAGAPAQEAAPPEQVADPGAAPTAEPGVAAPLTAEREAAYQALIRQANERLQAAYDQIKAQQAVQQPAAVAPAALTSDQAAAIALQAAPGAVLLRLPQLVNYQGIAAFEVLLNQGVLYINAQTGQILYNGVLSAPGTLGSGGAGNRFSVSAGQEKGGGSNAGDEDHSEHSEHSSGA